MDHSRRIGGAIVRSGKLPDRKWTRLERTKRNTKKYEKNLKKGLQKELAYANIMTVSRN